MRKLASIQKIISIKPIDGADKIERATVLGWDVVVRKDSFKEGDLCIFFEIDSIISKRFLDYESDSDLKVRLKTVKMKGQISQGLIAPIYLLDKYDGIEMVEDFDLTEILGVEKYEPAEKFNLGMCKGNFPHYVPKTDETRIQSVKGVIAEFSGKKVYITQKIDGTSFTISNRNGEVDVCSRNLSKKESDCVYWKITQKHDLINKITSLGFNCAIQGEIAGPSIQQNPLGLNEHSLFVFNVYNIDENRYLNFDEFILLCAELELPTVPILAIKTFDYTSVSDLLEAAKGTYPSGRPQEGIVIRPVEEFFSNRLKSRASFKVINNDFLLKEK